MDDEQFDQLLERADVGDTAAVLAALDQDPSLVNRAGFNGWTLLMRAGIEGFGDLVEELLERGANVHAFHMNGWAALTFAAGRGHYHILTILCDRGADPNQRRDATNVTALGRAAFRDHVDCCTMLLARGADLFTTWDGSSAIDTYGGAFENAEFPTRPPLTKKEKKQRILALHAAFAAGPHPSQVERRAEERRAEAWKRRWPFLMILTGHDFQPLAARRAVLAALHPPLPTNAVIPPLPNRTRAQRYALLRNKVLTHPGLWKLVASFL